MGTMGSSFVQRRYGGGPLAVEAQLQGGRRLGAALLLATDLRDLVLGLRDDLGRGERARLPVQVPLDVGCNRQLLECRAKLRYVCDLVDEAQCDGVADA